MPSINFVKDGHRFSRFFRQEHQEIGLIRDAFDKQKGMLIMQMSQTNFSLMIICTIETRAMLHSQIIRL